MQWELTLGINFASLIQNCLQTLAIVESIVVLSRAHQQLKTKTTNDFIMQHLLHAINIAVVIHTASVSAYLNIYDLAVNIKSVINQINMISRL